MTREQAQEKLKKLKALAERGVGGEKETAMKLHRELMKKYEIEEEEILSETLKVHWFGYRTELEEILLLRIFYKVTESRTYHVYTKKYSRRKKRGCECTEIEAAEIKLLFEFYRNELKRELETFIAAFISGNRIYPDKTARCYEERKDDDREPTPEEMRQMKKAQFMALMMDKRKPPRAMIGEYEEEGEE